MLFAAPSSWCRGLKSPLAPAYFTICVRLMFSTTTASWVSPTFRLISASLLVHGAFGLDSHRGSRHAQHPVLVAIFADGLAEQQLAPATPFLLPAIARPRGHGKRVANVNRMV